MKIKKMFYKIGILPIILILSIGLIGAVPVMADDPVEPQAAWAQGTYGSPVVNSGTDVISFSWECSAWTGTPVYYTFAIWRQSPSELVGIQYSDSFGTDDLVNPPTSLQNIAGFSGGQSIYNPDNLGGGDPAANAHDWLVPYGLADGQYYGALEVYTTKEGLGTTLEADTSLSFYVQQATADLTVYKEDEGSTPLNDWEFNIEGGDVYTNLNGTTAGSGSYTFSGIPIGDYTVTETLKTDWVCLNQDGTPPDAVVPVNFIGVNEVTFVNQQNVGSLHVYKVTDPSDSESGWTFNIDGPTTGSDTTVGVGAVEFNGIPVGFYDITEDAETGFICIEIWEAGVGYDSVPEDREIENVEVVLGQTTEVYFTNQELGDLLITKYNYEGGAPWQGWKFTVYGPENRNVGPTDGNGEILVEDLIPGTYTIVETHSPMGVYYVCTEIYWVNDAVYDGDPEDKTITDVDVDAGDTAEVDFTNQQIIRQIPTLGQWGIIALSTIFVALLVWFGVRRRQTA